MTKSERERFLEGEVDRMQAKLQAIKEMAQRAIDTGGREEMNPADVLELADDGLGNPPPFLADWEEGELE